MKLAKVLIATLLLSGCQAQQQVAPSNQQRLVCHHWAGFASRNMALLQEGMLTEGGITAWAIAKHQDADLVNMRKLDYILSEVNKEDVSTWDAQVWEAGDITQRLCEREHWPMAQLFLQDE